MNILKLILFTIIISISIPTELNAMFLNDNCGIKLLSDLTEEEQINYAGIKSNPNSNQVYFIDAKDTTICKSDISYQMLHLIFGRAATDTEVSKSIFYFFHTPDESVENLSMISNVGATIKTLYQSLTVLLFVIVTFVISWQTIKYVITAQKSGQFLGSTEQGQKKALYVGITSLIVIIMVTPIGSMMLIQVILLSLAVLGIKLANYFLSGFLNTTGVESAKVQVSDQILLLNGNAVSETLITGSLCEYQTKQAILNNGYKAGSMFVEKSWYEYVLIFNWFGNDDRIALDKANKCTSYYDIMDYNYLGKEPKVNSITSRLASSYDKCENKLKLFSPMTRIKTESGFTNDCYSASWNWPADNFMKFILNSKEASDVYKIYENNFKNGRYQSEFSFAKGYDSLSSGIDNIISEINNKEFLTKDAENEFIIKELNKIIFESTDDYTSRKIKSPLINSNENLLNIPKNSLSNLANNEIAQLLYIKHLTALNYLTGAYVDQKHPLYSEVSQQGFFSYAALTDKNIQKLYPEATVSGLSQIIKKLADPAGQSILRSQCASILGSGRNTENYESYLTYKQLKDNPRKISSRSKMNFNCLKVVHDIKSSSDLKSKKFPEIKHFILDDPSNEAKDIKSLYSSLVSQTEKNAFEAVSENEEIISKYIQINNESAIKNRMSLSFYNYLVTKLIVESLSAHLKENIDNSVLVNTRQKGWASLPGMMLEISTKQVNAAAMINDLYNSFKITAYVSIDENGNYSFVNPNAFYDAAIDRDYASESNEIKIDINKISPIDAERAMILANTSKLSDKNASSSTNEISRSMTEKFITFLIEFIFTTPLNYLKVGAGLTDGDGMNKSVPDLLKECSEKTDCYPSTTHPLNAVTMFGQSILNNVVVMLMITKVVNLLNDAVNKDIGGQSTVFDVIGKTPFGSALIIMLRVLLAVIDFMLTFLKPAFYVLAFVGVLCGYILPAIPYLMGTIVILGWYLSIFIITLAIPIFFLMLARIREDGQTQFNFQTLWSKCGTILVKPALITIAIIFSWVFVNISIYYVNSTIYVLFNLSGDSGLLYNLIKTIITYVIFMFVLYFTIQHSFKIILNFATEVERIIGINSMNDNSIYSSLNVENLLLANKISGTVSQMDNQVKGEILSPYTNKLRNNIAKKKAESEKYKTEKTDISTKNS